jgi:hypothetical protein
MRDCFSRVAFDVSSFRDGRRLRGQCGSVVRPRRRVGRAARQRIAPAPALWNHGSRDFTWRLPRPLCRLTLRSHECVMNGLLGKRIHPWRRGVESKDETTVGGVESEIRALIDREMRAGFDRWKWAEESTDRAADTHQPACCRAPKRTDFHQRVRGRPRHQARIATGLDSTGAEVASVNTFSRATGSEEVIALRASNFTSRCARSLR